MTISRSRGAGYRAAAGAKRVSDEAGDDVAVGLGLTLRLSPTRRFLVRCRLQTSSWLHRCLPGRDSSETGKGTLQRLVGSARGLDTGSRTPWFCVPVRSCDSLVGTPR